MQGFSKSTIGAFIAVSALASACGSAPATVVPPKAIPKQQFGSPVTITTSSGFKFQIEVAKPTFSTTEPRQSGTPRVAPPNQDFIKLVARITNVQKDSPAPLDNFYLGLLVPIKDAPAFGFTGSSASSSGPTDCNATGYVENVPADMCMVAWGVPIAGSATDVFATSSNVVLPQDASSQLPPGQSKTVSMYFPKAALAGAPTPFPATASLSQLALVFVAPSGKSHPPKTFGDHRGPLIPIPLG